jgi:hypothetical protein
MSQLPVDQFMMAPGEAVPCGVGDPGPMLLNEFVHDLTSGGEAFQRAEFVLPNQSRVPRDVRRENRGKVSFNPLFLLRRHPSSARQLALDEA